MVLFKYAAEIPDMPSKYLVVIQGSTRRVGNRFERLVEISPKVSVGVIDHDEFLGMLADMGHVVQQTRGFAGPRCHRCNLVYLKGGYTRCIICGGPLAAGPRKSRRKVRRYVEVEEHEPGASYIQD